MKKEEVCMSKLTNEQQKILNMVSKYGCLHIEQAYILLNPIQTHIASILLNMLVKNDYMDLLQGQYLVMKNSPKGYNPDTIACIWTMMELAQNNEEIFESLKATPPATIFFTRNNRESFEIVSLNESNLINIRTMQDKIIARNKQFEDITNSWYVFVIDNKEIIAKIKKCNLKFPFIVALHGKSDSNSANSKPAIKFMKSIPKTNE